MTKLSLGLLGAGEVAQLIHLPILQQMQDRYQIAALYDPSPSVLNAVADKWAVSKRYDTVETLLADEDVDAVMVLSPDQFHGEHARAALRAGKHVFLEKPACLTVADLQSLIEVQQQTDRQVMIGYMRCYAPAFMQGQKLLQQMSDIRYARVRDLICEGPWFFRKWSEVVTPADDISADVLTSGRAKRLADLTAVCGEDAPPAILKSYEVLTGLGVHSLSAVRMLLGSPRRVISAHVGQDGTQIHALLDYGNFVTSYECLIDDVVRFDATIEVLSRREELSIHYDTPYIRNLPGRTVFQASSESDNSSQTFGPFYKDPFQVELEHFHDVLTTGVPVRTHLHDAVRDLELCQEIIKVAKLSFLRKYNK
ncbi:Gfo/Idh/MocA family oxidoreductase [Acetobacter senegalensis]|uniref:Gfo/Idh/MocA family oxidoreductase n=1 Tax=Acetobacter senegalensis TaxID=446692 RepID=UPI0026561144|nr:Gfo/Idh/MocA family oxidoreductase [Acetobacter senegalensis]MDN7353088.1 Gfo/Idh/MocA family oxidoreductase [Acetobacter senegalensis]